MSWSQLRKQMKTFLCEPLVKRLDFHLTSYRIDRKQEKLDLLGAPGRGWITLDGKEIVNFAQPNPWGASNQVEVDGVGLRQDFYEVIRDYPQLSIEEALQSPNYLVQGFAVVDRRVGKKRLLRMNSEQLHPFVKMMYELRRSTF